MDADEIVRAYRLGVLRLVGPAEARDPAAGVAAVRRAAEAGLAPAMFRLGVMLAIGQLVPRDDEEAARWVRAADEARSEVPPAEADAPDEPPPAAAPAAPPPQPPDGPLRDAVDPPPSLRAMRRALREAAHEARAAVDVDLLSHLEAELFDPDASPKDTLEKAVARIFSYGLGHPKDPERARIWVHLAAEAGDREAQAARGARALKEGFDPVEARRWLVPAAGAGERLAAEWLGWLDELAAAEAEGGLRLGLMLANADGMGGDWPGPDPARAAGLFEAAADAGDPLGASMRAWQHLVGRGCPIDVAAAATWYERVLALVGPDATGELEAGANRVLDVDLVREQVAAIHGRADLEARAAAGDRDAQWILATHLADGLGGRVEDDRAEALREAAARAGQPEALVWLNETILRPEHLPALRAAAEAGHDGCAFIAGRELVDDDLPAALGYLRQAAAGGLNDAQYLLGELHRDGLPSGEPDWAEAAGWFAAAARQVHWAAAMEAARMYREGGHGLAADPAAAREMYALAAELGDPQALFAHGVMLARGEGGPPDPLGAYRLFRDAAALGEADAGPWLARLREQLPAADLEG